MSFPTSVPNGRRHLQGNRAYEYNNGVWQKVDKHIVSKSNTWTTTHYYGQNTFSGDSGIFRIYNPIIGSGANNGGLVFINCHANNNPDLSRNSYVRFNIKTYNLQVVQQESLDYDEQLFDYGAGASYSGFGFSFYIGARTPLGALKVSCGGEFNIRNQVLGSNFTWQAFVYGTSKQ